jgi:CHC2 zinc finger
MKGQQYFSRSQLPVPSNFYSAELGKLTRPSRGWVRGNCPFHESKSRTSFSINLDSGAFHCFGCGVHGGDVISFVRHRYSLDFKGALRYLRVDSTITWAAESVRALRQERERRQAEEAVVEADRLRQRIDVRNWLHLLDRISDQANERLCELRQGAPERFAGEEECLWGILADSLPQIREAEQEYFTLAGVNCE